MSAADNTMRAELLPCPFCNGAASMALCGFGSARVTCTDCGSEGTYCRSTDEAVVAWNRRAGTARMVADAVAAEREAWVQQHGRDSAELRRLCQHRDNLRRDNDMLKVENAALEASLGHLSRLVDDLRPGHDRYQFLRERPVDAIAINGGGVFAGKVPDNVVLNGEDLDSAVDAAIRARSTTPEAGEQPAAGNLDKQITRAHAEFASCTPERRAQMRLQGGTNG